jgi:hypothetical protein
MTKMSKETPNIFSNTYNIYKYIGWAQVNFNGIVNS